MPRDRCSEGFTLLPHRNDVAEHGMICTAAEKGILKGCRRKGILRGPLLTIVFLLLLLEWRPFDLRVVEPEPGDGNGTRGVSNPRGNRRVPRAIVDVSRPGGPRVAYCELMCTSVRWSCSSRLPAGAAQTRILDPICFNGEASRAFCSTSFITSSR